MRTLSKADAEEYVYAYKYEAIDENKYLTRCIDGRYKNTSTTPTCALPGADAGDLAILYATARSCGFEVDYKKALSILLNLIGGVQNFSLHTDAYSSASECDHLHQVRLHYKDYYLEEEDIEILDTQIAEIKKMGVVATLLEGRHQPTAVLQITGDWGVPPHGMLTTDRGDVNTQVMVFHSSRVNDRHKKWAEALVAEKAVKLGAGLDEEYLYQVMSTTTEDHLLETLRRMAKGLPIYQVRFEKGGAFEVESLGTVQ